MEEINFPRKSNDYKKFEKYNTIVALSIFVNKPDENNIEIKQAYVSEHSLIIEKTVLLMILNEEKCLYVAVTKLLTLFRNVILKHGDFNYLNCLLSCRTELKCNSLEKVCRTKSCEVVMSNEEKNILKYCFI